MASEPQIPIVKKAKLSLASESQSLIVKKAKQSLNGHELHIQARGEEHQYELGRSVGLTTIECKKNPGHVNFIPRASFKLEHLPPEYRDQLLFDFVDSTAELTGLITVKHVSEGRPETWPGTQNPYPCGNVRGQDMCQSGTGRVCWVYELFYTDKKCPCGVCAVSETPSTMYGEFEVLTAAHVVVDSLEAKNSEMKLFYKSGSTSGSQVKLIYGEKLEDGDTDRDWSHVVYVTHDKALHDKLRETWKQWDDLSEKLYDKYWHNKSNNKEPDLAVIVSHPHSFHQHVTVGRWTHTEKDGKEPHKFSRYTYSADTCPGSSGATVLLPGLLLPDGWFGRHPHSRACPPGLTGNQSAIYWNSFDE